MLEGRAPAPLLPNKDLSTELPPRELVLRNIETERLETIPLGRVITEQALIDDHHADELGRSMARKRGQLTPIAVRARFDDEGEIAYDILDGFHRSAGKKRRGEDSIKATVVYGCSDEEMMDLRILAASSVKTVQFPRLAEWMAKSFEMTPWAKQGITVATAFGVTSNDRQRPRIDLDEEEVAQLKTWVREKSQSWGKSVASTYTILKVVENADPEMVKKVRNKGGGKDRSGHITPTLLGIVVEEYPGESNYFIQRALLNVVVERRYYVPEAQVFLAKIAPLINSQMSEEEIYEIANQLTIAPEAMQAAISEFKDEEAQKKRKRKNQTAHTLFKTPEIETSNEIKQEIEGLKARIDALITDGVDAWWKTAHFISDEERTILDRVIRKGDDLNLISLDLRTNPERLIKLMISAFTKRRLHKEMS